MKKGVYLFVFIFLFLTTTTKSLQARKSNWYITPRVGINSLTGDMGKDIGMGFGIGATIEYMLQEKSSFYGGISYNPFPSSTTNMTLSDSYGNDTTLGVDQTLSDFSVFAGYNFFFGKVRKHITPFISIEAGYAFISQTAKVNGNINSSSIDGSSSYSYAFFAPCFGLTYPLNKEMYLSLRGRYMISFVNSKDYSQPYGMQNSTSFTDYNYWSVQVGFSYAL